MRGSAGGIQRTVLEALREARAVLGDHDRGAGDRPTDDGATGTRCGDLSRRPAGHARLGGRVRPLSP